MQRAVVITNETCNQNCTFCTQRRPAESPAFVTAAAVRRRIDAAAAAGARELLLSGGEPTLRRDLVALVAHARAAAGTVILATNAARIDDRLAAALHGAGLAGARVQLIAWGETADAVTRDPGGAAATLAGLHALARAGVPITITTPIVRANLELAPQLPDALAASGLPITALVLGVPVTAPAGAEASLAGLADVTTTITAIAEAARRVGLTVQLDPATYLPPCLFPRPERIAHLYALSRGGSERDAYRRISACDPCAARDRCPGLPAALLARGAPPMRPIVEDRVRRRLTVISSVADQIQREMITHETHRGPGGEVPAAIVRVNFHCNQACLFCFVSTHLPPPADADVRAAIVAISRRHGVLALSGGEPTLNPRLADYVRLGKREGARHIELQTNAIRLSDPALARELAAAGVDEALVSMHGPSAEISDAVTAAPGTFEKTARGVDELIASDIRVRLNFVFCEVNRAHFPAFVELVARRWPGATITFSFVGSHTDVVPRSAALIPRYSDILPALVAGLAAAHAAGVTITGFESKCGMPLCLVPGGHTLYFELPEISPGADGGEFIKPDACGGCALTARCWGLRRGYVELHGVHELRPVTASQA